MLSHAPLPMKEQPLQFLSTLRSPLPGVSNAAWVRFAAALEVQAPHLVSASGGYGSYDLRPRRLVDLGYARAPRRVRTKAGRMIYVCEFVEPWTQERFLADLLAQHQALALSMRLYHQDLTAGKLQRPQGLSLAGALAILHVGGPGALRGWPTLFKNTRARFARAQGAF